MTESSSIDTIEQELKYSRKLPYLSLFIALATTLVISLFFYTQKFTIFDYKINDIARTTIIAPFDFPIYKSEEELQMDRAEALRQVPMVFHFDPQVQIKAQNELRAFFNDLSRLRSTKSRLSELSRLPNKTPEDNQKFLADSLTFQTLLSNFTNTYRLEKKTGLLQFLINEIRDNGQISISKLSSTLQQILGEAYNLPIADVPRKNIVSGKISIKKDSEEQILEANQITTIEEVWAKVKISLQEKLQELNTNQLSLCYELLVAYVKPNLIYQKELTEKRQKEAIDKIPLSKGVILENEKIVDANTKITPDVYQKLQSLRIEQANRRKLHDRWSLKIPFLGEFFTYLEHLFMVIIISAFFAAFLFSYKPAILKSPRLVTLLCINFLLITALAYLFCQKLLLSTYVIPIPLTAMTLTILFDSKIAFCGVTTLCVLICAQTNAPLSFLIVSLFASIFAILAVRHLRKRSQLFQASLYLLIAYTFSVSILEYIKFSSFKEISNHLIYAAINALLSPILTYGLVGILEKPFGITTDLTLLELADFNHPLLKLLSREATGTFTHSITVGNLAEAAAETIGANPLLARVGAYYHDIGKIYKPEYFVENQAFDINRHDKLTPSLSAMIIINHVKEGIRLAREYKLPQAVIEFIPTHHGTTRVEYFYNKALENAKNPSEVNEEEFRYPGPKPRTKETGIVMICETIEAICRTLDKPTLTTIEKVVDSVIEQRLREGQLDECPLTLAELKKIKGNLKEGTGILPILKGIHHARIEYPGQEERFSS